MLNCVSADGFCRLSVCREAARRLATQSWLVPDSLKTIEGTKIPIITMRVRVGRPNYTSPLELSCNESRKPDGQVRDTLQVPADHAFDSSPTEVPIDISFEAADNQGLEAVTLVRNLVTMFPMLTPLTLFLKRMLPSSLSGAECQNHSRYSS